MALQQAEFVGGTGAAGELGLKGGFRLKLFQEPRHRRRIVARPDEVADAELVGLQFLVAAIPGERELRAAADGGLGKARAGIAEQHAAQDRRGDRTGLGEHAGAVALRRMPRRDMADLVAEHARKLCLGRGQGDQSTGRVDEPARQGEGVHDVRIEHGETPIEPRQLGALGQRSAEPGHIGVERGIGVFAAELRDDPGVLLAPDPHLVGRRHEGGEIARPGGGIDRAATELERPQDEQEKGDHGLHGRDAWPATHPGQASPALRAGKQG
jgi:hypothetical protein